MSKSESDSNKAAAVEDDDEPDDWDKRIFSTGCAEENTKMNDCYFEKKDWRLCRDEVRDAASGFSDFNPYHVSGNKIKCWKQHQNDKRTEMKDA